MSRLEELAAKALARDGMEPAILFEGRWRSWGEVRHVAETVQHLVAASGAPSRARVLLIARNVPAVLAAFLGLIAKAHNIRTVYSFQSPSAIAADIAGLKPAVIAAAQQDFADEIRTAMREHGVAGVVLRDGDAELLAGFDRSTAPSEAGAPAEPTIEFQTSGTTGPPKRFPVTYDMAHRHFVERLAPSATSEESHERAPALLYMSLGNLSGMMSSLPALVLGQRMLLYDRFNLKAWCDYIRTYRPVHSGLQPAAVQMLLDADVPREDLASLRTLIIGSAPLDAKVHRAFEARYGIAILLAYGATEFCGTVASMTETLREVWGEKKFGSVGPAVPGVELRTADMETGRVLPPGEQGVLEVYSERLRPDWIRTSDLGVIDEDGFLFIRGRADGAIIRGGFKLLPETIERGLLCHEAVSVAAVVGVADRRLGQVPAAAVQFAPGAKPLSAEELKSHLRRQVPATHIPVHWRFVEELPRTSSMKVDRRAVAQLFEESPSDTV